MYYRHNSAAESASTSGADPLFPLGALDCLERSDGTFATPSRNDSSNGALGRGNRKRKKRKFFDEDEADDNNEDEDEDSSACSSAKKVASKKAAMPNIRHQQQSNVDEADVRRSVFHPGYDPDPDGGHSNSPPGRPEQQSLNSVFVCQKLPLVTRKRFSMWLPGEVAQLVRTMLPYLGEQAAARLVEEEVDGEAFLMLTQADLIRGLGLKLGPALKLYNAIHLVKATLKD